jgi:sec-independent protein translocase protein TatB
MFDLGWSELLLVAVVALVVIGPKDLPVAMRAVGRWVGKARAMSRHVRAGFDEMVRQAELEEMERQWKKTNEAIMAATPMVPDPFPESLPGATPASPAAPSADGPADTPASDDRRTKAPPADKAA